METNAMELSFDSRSVNEAFARVVAGAFALQLDPTLEELSDIKTAISEAVTNAIVHGYPGAIGKVILKGRIESRILELEVCDAGVGIEDVEQARQPFFTTSEGDDRSGMGITMMETFMDIVEIKSMPGVGTNVRMLKAIGKKGDAEASAH